MIGYPTIFRSLRDKTLRQTREKASQLFPRLPCINVRRSSLFSRLRRVRRLLGVDPRKNWETAAPFASPSQEPMVDYSVWTHSDLVDRIQQLEKDLAAVTVSKGRSTTPTAKAKRSKDLRPVTIKSTRFIALKFAYLGANYNGFEYHVNNPTPLPTVEEVLFKALLKARLVPGTGGGVELKNWPGDEVAGYSKCGRTDRGVSSFGQVVTVRVRSNRPVQEGPTEQSDGGESGTGWDPIKDELQYVQILNRLLPPDIRVLAWSDVPEGFSARFNCRMRKYKYFFTNPGLPPFPSRNKGSEVWLDIDKMNAAAKLYEGEHDFRNFCKLDASKQIDNFKRIIFHSSIEEANSEMPSFFPMTTPSGNGSTSLHKPRMYVFNLHGTAFLWHQVRQMIAILLLIGQGLEQPSLITSLLDVEKVPGKPQYEMADDRPLVLWDCVFSEGEVKWIYPSADASLLRNTSRDTSLVDTLWENWHERKLEETLAKGLFESVLGEVLERRKDENAEMPLIKDRGIIILDGSSHPKLKGRYKPVLSKPRMESVDVINKRFAERKGDDLFWKKKKRELAQVVGRAEAEDSSV